MGRHNRGNGNQSVLGGHALPLNMMQGRPMMHEQHLMSPHQAAAFKCFLIHHEEFANAHPAVIRFETTEGPFFKVLGGMSKLEQAAITIGAGPLSAAECIEKAKEILRLCAIEQEIVNHAKQEAARQAAQQEQQPDVQADEPQSQKSPIILPN